MPINIPSKKDGDKLTANEFNSLVNAVKTLEENSGGAGDIPTTDIPTTEDQGFFIVDKEKKIGMKYDTNGLDVAKLSDHFKSLLPKSESGGGSVNKFFPVLK